MIRSPVDRQHLAQEQFERRSIRYQGSFAQRIYCRPTSHILLARLELAPGSRVLDVGCGTGQLLVDIRDRFPTTDLHGLDLCVGMIRSAKALVGAGASLIQGESQSLPFPDDHFDAVVCTHCFHHFPDQLRSLKEMGRVLRSGGIAMVLDGDRDGMWGRVLYDVFVARAEGSVKHRSASDMQQFMREAGLVEIEQVRAFPLSPVLLTTGRAEKNARQSPG
jgi:ubiquinone/menaquinone biosynthesis C-methylase UbiE